MMAACLGSGCNGRNSSWDILLDDMLQDNGGPCGLSVCLLVRMMEPRGISALLRQSAYVLWTRSLQILDKVIADAEEHH